MSKDKVLGLAGLRSTFNTECWDIIKQVAMHKIKNQSSSSSSSTPRSWRSSLWYMRQIMSINSGEFCFVSQSTRQFPQLTNICKEHRRKLKTEYPVSTLSPSPVSTKVQIMSQTNQQTLVLNISIKIENRCLKKLQKQWMNKHHGMQLKMHWPYQLSTKTSMYSQNERNSILIYLVQLYMELECKEKYDNSTNQGLSHYNNTSCYHKYTQGIIKHRQQNSENGTCLLRYYLCSNPNKCHGLH